MRSCGPTNGAAPNQVSKPRADDMGMAFEQQIKDERYRQAAKHKQGIETKRRKRELGRMAARYDIQKHQDRVVNCIERKAELCEFAGEAQE
jgi:hypothetical protein